MVFFEPFITGIFSSHSTYYYRAGTELETKESIPITLNKVKKVFNTLIDMVPRETEREVKLIVKTAEVLIIIANTIEL